MSMIFISHASADHAIAAALAKHLETHGSGVKAFLASRPGDIRADADTWSDSVLKALRDADTYVILLTPNSVQRPWVSFEAGAAWFSERRCILVRAGLKPEEIPSPLSFKQVYSLEVVADAQAVLRALDIEPGNINEFVDEVLSLAQEIMLVGEEEPAWEGVEFQGTFYAWAGPLIGLRDEAGIPYHPQLLDVLKERGLAVSFGNPEKLSEHFGRGRCQVFATDRKSWRRPVGRDRQLLLVTSPEDLKRWNEPTLQPVEEDFKGPPNAADIAGTWVSDDFKFDGDVISATFTFKRYGPVIAGTLLETKSYKNALNIRGGITDVNIHGDHINFIVMMDVWGMMSSRQYPLRFAGVLSGDRLRLAALYKDGPAEFTATRVSALPNPS